MLDLVLRIMIVAVIAGIAVPRFSDVTQVYQLQAAVQRIETDLNHARRRARTTGQSETVTFDPDSERYSFSSATHLNSSGQLYSVVLNEPPYSADLVRATFGSVTQVTFNGFGVADNSGAVLIRVGSHSKEISLDATTSLISVN
jgi:Tfp pilus assembly protein FimT